MLFGFLVKITAHPISSGSVSEASIPLGLHPPKTPPYVAILDNIRGTRAGKALLAGCPLILRPLSDAIAFLTPLLLF